MTATLHALPERPDVWRGRRSQAPVPSTPTGHAPLDEALPSNGWPMGLLCEILHEADGVGELALLLPALARLGSDSQPVVWVAPPYRLNAVALRQSGVALRSMRVIETDDSQALWAAEQCLRAGCCAAVLVWTRSASGTALRRLQLAAETGRGHGFVFRDMRHLAEASPAPIRLSVRREQGRPALQLHKCRGLLSVPAQALGEIRLP